jgi:hypothetical protein
MRKLILAGLIVAIGLSPALVAAQTSPGTADKPGTNPAPSSRPGSPPGGSIPNTPGMPPAPPSGSGSPSTESPSTGSSTQRFTNKADCERAGGKWDSVQKKCGMGG